MILQPPAQRLLHWVGRHERMLVRLGVVLVLLGYEAGVGLVLAKKQPLYGVILSALPFAVVGFLWLSEHLAWTPLAILGVALFVPFSLPTGTGSRLVFSLVLAAAVAGAWVLRMLVVERHFWLKATRVNLPVLGFILTTLVSLGWGILFRDPTVFTPGSFILVQAASGLVMVLLPAMLILVASRVETLGSLKAMVAVFLVAGVFGLFKAYTDLPLPVNTNGLFSLWVIALSTSLALFNRRLSGGLRLGLLALALGWVVWGFVLHFDWLAGWLPGFVAIGVISLLRSRWLVVALAVLLAGYIALNWTDITSHLLVERTSSGLTRLAAWQMNWQVTSQHLLLGTGPAGYTVYYMSYFPTDAMATHSNYIDVVAQTGLIGLVFYLWLFGALIWLGIRAALRLRGRGDFSESLAVAALSGAAACVVIQAFGDWLLPFAYTQTIAGFDYAVYSWLFMGAVLVLDTKKPT